MIDPKGWDINKLRAFLSAPITQENSDYDFKEMLPLNSEDTGKNNLRKLFCAFANTKGGYIFFGIKDDKTIIGIEYNKEFLKNLSQIMDRGIKPFPSFDIYETIETETNSGKYVYIVKVKESPYYEKPHAFYKDVKGSQSNDGGIYVREPGQSMLITDGIRIRRMILMEEGYYPEYDRHVLKILEDFGRRYPKKFSFFEIIILQKFQSFLQLNLNKSNEQILIRFLSLQEKMADLEKETNHHVCEGQLLSANTSKKQVLLDEELRHLIKEIEGRSYEQK